MVDMNLLDKYSNKLCGRSAGKQSIKQYWVWNKAYCPEALYLSTSGQ